MWAIIHTVPFFFPFFLATMLDLMTEGSLSSGTSTLSTLSKPLSCVIR